MEQLNSSVTDTPMELQSPISFTYILCPFSSLGGSQAGLQLHPSLTTTCLDLKAHSVKVALGDVLTAPSRQFITSKEEYFNDAFMIYWSYKGLLKSRSH